MNKEQLRKRLMKTPSKIDKARLIVQARNAWIDLPAANEVIVIKLAKKPLNELNDHYKRAVKAMSAMRWNTATLGV
jgi:hypothetical protein